MSLLILCQDFPVMFYVEFNAHTVKKMLVKNVVF